MGYSILVGKELSEFPCVCEDCGIIIIIDITISVGYLCNMECLTSELLFIGNHIRCLLDVKFTICIIFSLVTFIASFHVVHPLTELRF